MSVDEVLEPLGKVPGQENIDNVHVRTVPRFCARLPQACDADMTEFQMCVTIPLGVAKGGRYRAADAPVRRG